MQQQVMAKPTSWWENCTLIYPLLVWGLGAVFLFYKYLLQVSPSVMTTELMQTFGVAATGLGILDAFYFYAYLVMQIPVGILLDRFSPRKITSMAIIVCAAGAILFANAHSLLVASLGRILIGLGASFAAVSCLKMITLWFSPRRFPLMAGLMMAAAMLGAVFGNAPLAAFVETMGWRHALYICGLCGMGLAVFFWLIVRDRSIADDEKEIEASENVPHGLQGLWRVLRCKQTWFLSLYSGLAFAPVSVFGGLWGVPFLMVSHHYSRTLAASEISFIFIGFAIGCPIGGWLAGILGRNRMLMGLGTLLALITSSAAIYLPIQSSVVLGTLLFLFGFGASFFMLCFSMIKQIHPLMLAATAIGFMNTFDSACEALSLPLIGRLLDLGWAGKLFHGAPVFEVSTYHSAFLILPFYLVVALITLFFVKEVYFEQT